MFPTDDPVCKIRFSSEAIRTIREEARDAVKLELEEMRRQIRELQEEVVKLQERMSQKQSND